MSIEAMKKALDVLVQVTTVSGRKARDNHPKAVSGLREAIAAAEKAKPVSAQHRFRHPQRSAGKWSPWQPCEVVDRPAWQLDSQGYEVEFRKLYAIPPDTAAMLAEKDALLQQALEALEGFANITNDSQGVKGYHLNGDIAEWDEFDEVNAASSAIKAIRQNLGVKND